MLHAHVGKKYCLSFSPCQLNCPDSVYFPDVISTHSAVEVVQRINKKFPRGIVRTCLSCILFLFFLFFQNIQIFVQSLVLVRGDRWRWSAICGQLTGLEIPEAMGGEDFLSMLSVRDYQFGVVSCLVKFWRCRLVYGVCLLGRELISLRFPFSLA